MIRRRELRPDGGNYDSMAGIRIRWGGITTRWWEYGPDGGNYDPLAGIWTCKHRTMGTVVSRYHSTMGTMAPVGYHGTMGIVVLASRPKTCLTLLETVDASILIF